MGIIYRQSILNSINNYVGVALGFITTVLLFPNIFSTEEYGLTRVLISFSLVYGLISELGIQQTTLRYFPYFKNANKDHHGILFLIIAGSFIGLALFFAVFFLFEPWITSAYIEQSPMFAEYIFFAIPMVISILFFANLSNYVKALMDTVFASFVSEVLLRLSIIAGIICYYFSWLDFTGFVYFFVGAYALQPLVMVVYIFYIGEFRIKPDFKFLRPSMLKSMFSYSMFSLLAGVTTQLMGNIDILMLGALTGLTDTAIYTVAFFVGSVIVIPQRSISKIAVPVIADSFKRKDFENIKTIYRKSSFNQIIAGVLVFIGVVANLDNFFLMLPDEYARSGSVIIAIGLARVFDMATGVNTPIIQISKFYRFDLIAKILLVLLAIGTNLLFIPMYGMFGAALATCISIVLYNTMKLIYLWIKLDMQPFSLKSIYIFIIGALVLWASYLLPMSDHFVVDILIRSLLITISYTGIILAFRLSEDLENLLVTIKERISNQ